MFASGCLSYYITFIRKCKTLVLTMSPPRSLVHSRWGFCSSVPPEVLVVCRLGDRGAAGTAANDHPVIPHAHADGITGFAESFLWCYGALLFSWRTFGTEFDDFFFVYSITFYIELIFLSLWYSIYPGLTEAHKKKNFQQSCRIAKKLTKQLFRAESY